MATRLYLVGAHGYSSPVEPSSWSSGWDATNTGFPQVALPSGHLGLDGSAGLSNSGTGTSGDFVSIARHVSPPLAAQTISGTVSGVLLCFQSNVSDSYTLAIAIKVITPTGADRGVLLAVSASDDTSSTPPEMATSPMQRQFRDSAESTSITLSSLAVSDGDRIVIETGFRQASTSINGGTLYHRGDSASSDCPANDTGTTTLNTWVEFSDDIGFNSVYPLAVSATPNDSSSATGTSDPTVVTPPTEVMKAGDLVLMIGQQRAASATLSVSEAGGQSWTSEAAISTTNQTARLFWCVFDGTWDANPSVDFSATTCNSVTMHVIRPASPADTWAVNQALVELDIASAATHTITGQTTTGSDTTITLAGWFSADDNTWGSLSGTGWETVGAAQYRNVSGSDQSATFAVKRQTAAGATGNVAKTQLTNGNDASTTFIITFSSAATGSVAAATGTSTPTATGKSDAASPASAAGTTTAATATGAANKTAVGSSTGVATATAGGSVLAPAVGSSAGTSTPTATGVGAALGVASAVGTTPSAAATGRSTVNVQGQASGVATDAVVGTGLKPTVGSAAGVATSNVQSGSAIGQLSGAGTSTVQATGRSTTNAVGSSAGVAADVVVGKGVFNGQMTSVNNANLNGVGKSTVNAVANATGTTTANAPGANVGIGTGSATGTTGGTGVGKALIDAYGESVGVSSVLGDGRALGFFDGIGISIQPTITAEWVGRSLAAALAESGGISASVVIARQHGWAKGQHGGGSWAKQGSV